MTSSSSGFGCIDLILLIFPSTTGVPPPPLPPLGMTGYLASEIQSLARLHLVGGRGRERKGEGGRKGREGGREGEGEGEGEGERKGREGGSEGEREGEGEGVRKGRE